MGNDRALTGIIWFRISRSAGCCAHGYETWDSTKCGNFRTS